MVTTEAAFAARVTCTTARTMALMFTLGDDAEDGVGGAWGAGTVGAREAKVVLRRRRARFGPMKEGGIVLVRPAAMLCW